MLHAVSVELALLPASIKSTPVSPERSPANSFPWASPQQRPASFSAAAPSLRRGVYGALGPPPRGALGNGDLLESLRGLIFLSPCKSSLLSQIWWKMHGEIASEQGCLLVHHVSSRQAKSVSLKLLAMVFTGRASAPADGIATSADSAALEANPLADPYSPSYPASPFQASAAPRLSFRPQLSSRQLARLARQASLTSRTSLCSVSSLVTRVSVGLGSQPAAARYNPIVRHVSIRAADI